ncbi:MAG: hypothetical protein IPJ78_19455 [Gemmatimonadetes bacterium]|nr:hypothetical protein [Gemmatimonadota bacterium]
MAVRAGDRQTRGVGDVGDRAVCLTDRRPTPIALPVPEHPMTSRRVGAAASCALVVLALASLPVLTRWLAQTPPRLTGDAFLDAKIAYQVVSALIMIAVVATVRFLGARERFLRAGDARAPAGAIRLLGVHAGEPWSVVGRNFAIIATAVTAVVVWLQVARGQEGLLAALPMSLLLALPFAAANAATEEGLVRLALLEGTVDVLGAPRAAMLSGGRVRHRSLLRCARRSTRCRTRGLPRLRARSLRDGDERRAMGVVHPLPAGRRHLRAVVRCALMAADGSVAGPRRWVCADR